MKSISITARDGLKLSRIALHIDGQRDRDFSVKSIVLLGSKSSANEVDRDDMQILDEVSIVQGTVCHFILSY